MKIEKKEKNVHFRVTWSEYNRLMEDAISTGEMKFSNYLRKKIFSGDREIEKIKLIRLLDMRLQQMIFQLRKVGVNINQIAHSCNAGYFFHGVSKIELLEKIDEMERTVNEGVKEIKEYLKEVDWNGNNEADVLEGSKER